MGSTALEGQRTCCMPPQSAPSPKVLQLAHWLPEETVTGCCILQFFLQPQPFLIFIFKLGGLHPQARNHRATWLRPPQGACFHRSHCWPEQSSDHLPTGMLMRCTCTVPWTTSSTSKTSVIKRKDHKRSTSKEFARFEFHIMHLATTRNVQKDWLSTDIHQLRPFRSSTSITGHTCVRSRERGCKADMLAWFASS